MHVTPFLWSDRNNTNGQHGKPRRKVRLRRITVVTHDDRANADSHLLLDLGADTLYFFTPILSKREHQAEASPKAGGGISHCPARQQNV